MALDPGPWVVAHRGGAALAPENTLAAFERSGGPRRPLRRGRPAPATVDGVCVVVHDANLRRVAGVARRVADLEWARLRRIRLPGGAAIPRIEEVFAAFPDARFMVDLKDRRAIPALSRAVRGYRLARRVCLAGADDDTLADAAAVLGPGGVRAAMGWRSAARLAAAARLGTRPRGVVPAPFVHVPLRVGRVPVFAGRLVTMTAELGAQVLVWTVDDTADMRRLLDAGVAGLITDCPDVARDVLIARGGWRPPSPGPASPAPTAAPGPALQTTAPVPGLPTAAPSLPTTAPTTG